MDTFGRSGECLDVGFVQIFIVHRGLGFGYVVDVCLPSNLAKNLRPTYKIIYERQSLEEIMCEPR